MFNLKRVFTTSSLVYATVTGYQPLREVLESGEDADFLPDEDVKIQHGEYLHSSDSQEYTWTRVL